MKYLLGGIAFFVLAWIGIQAQAQMPEKPQTVNMPITCAPASEQLADELMQAYDILILSSRVSKGLTIEQYVSLSKNKKVLLVSAYIKETQQYCIISITEKPEFDDIGSEKT